MRLIKNILAVASLAIFLPACSTAPHSHGPQVNHVDALQPPKSYNFLPDKAIAAADEAGSNADYWHGQVEKAIAAKLDRKGYKQANIASADYLVAFHVILQRGKETSFLDNYAGYKLSPKEQAEQADIEKYLTAPGSKNRSILIVDIIDHKRREVIWREWVQAPTRDRLTAREQQQRIDKAIKLIFAHFPPKK